ncbi:hypothetical protein [Haloarcula sediminis]|uniref:hypothetical protein n=1 Tax=Haloarcula sediminis TaxID=3111777 RepID=UPI002D76B357|nr:hypothetical protein [Haloarcula sp. CK38]
MTASTDSEYLTADRTGSKMQKLWSVSLCLVAGGLSVYTAVNGVWTVSALFALGLALATQSYRAVEDERLAVEPTE